MPPSGSSLMGNSPSRGADSNASEFDRGASGDAERFEIRLGAMFLRTARRIAMFLPERGYLVFAAFLGRITNKFLPGPREREIMDAQLAMVAAESAGKRNPAFADKKFRDQIALKCITHIAESMGEVFIIPKFLNQGKVRHGDETELHRHIGQGRGVLILSAHIGNFELLAASHAHRNMPLTVVGRRPNYPPIGRLLSDLRLSYGAVTIWRDDPLAGRKLIQALRSGRMVGVLPDQDTSLDSIFPPFFGVPAACPVGPVRVAIRLNAPIATSFIVRTGRFEHRVFTEMLPYESKDPEAEQTILGEYHRRLENIILEFPNQWIWWHRRWRREPGVDYRMHPERLRKTHSYVEWLREKAAA